MIEAARKAEEFLAGREPAELSANIVILYATVKVIEIVGEAAAHVSKDVCAQIPEIPWPSVIAMRNHLIHGYFDIDVDRVWAAVKHELPKLSAAIEQYLSRKDAP